MTNWQPISYWHCLTTQKPAGRLTGAGSESRRREAVRLGVAGLGAGLIVPPTLAGRSARGEPTRCRHPLQEVTVSVSAIS
jgi:hypothetical protein